MMILRQNRYDDKSFDSMSTLCRFVVISLTYVKGCMQALCLQCNDIFLSSFAGIIPKSCHATVIAGWFEGWIASQRTGKSLTKSKSGGFYLEMNQCTVTCSHVSSLQNDIYTTVPGVSSPIVIVSALGCVLFCSAGSTQSVGSGSNG